MLQQRGVAGALGQDIETDSAAAVDFLMHNI